MKKSLLLSMLWVILVVTSACAQKKDYPEPPPYIPHPKGELPITASYAFYHPYMNDLQMEWMIEAGFNNIQKVLNYEDTDSLLRLARKYDMNMFVSMVDTRDSTKTKSVVDRYKDEPLVWGFTIYDEPKASQFPMLKSLESRVAKYAPEQNGIINLLPAVWPQDLGASDYRTYVEDYVRTVNPPLISLDIYPVKLDKEGKIYIEPILYPTMEVIRDVSRESGRPFWSYILSNKHWNYPKPKEEYLRFQIFTALAYGAQGLSYYTYLMPDFDKWKKEYSDAPIDWDGNRTDTWYLVRNVNKEVRNLSHVFLGADVIDVSHTGEQLPKDTKRLTRLPAPFIGMESFGEGVQVSHLRNGKNEYLVLVNRDVLNKQKVRLSRSRAVTRIYGDGKEKLEKSPMITLQPGGYAIYRIR